MKPPMDEMKLNIKEPTGHNVIHSASGVIAHVPKPLGLEATRTLVSADVMQRVTDARKAASIDE